MTSRAIFAVTALCFALPAATDAAAELAQAASQPAQAGSPAPPRVAQPPKTAPATHVTKDEIQAFIAKMAPDRIADSSIRAVDVGGYRVGVFAVVRPKDSPQDAIYHDTNMTEILYILEGSATLITGGTIPDARPPARPGGNYTGTKIDGGTSRHVVPGDVIITPGRTPHLWQNIESDMRYLVFRPDPDGTLSLK
jgi:hypothetical protein